MTKNVKSNMDMPRNRGNLMLKGKQFLLHMCHQSCYSYYKHVVNSGVPGFCRDYIVLVMEVMRSCL
jgi:hypothetical protein